MASTRPTLAMVADRAGVSVSTASLAFSGAGPITQQTRDRVLAAAAELHYSGPNPLGRQLRSGRSGIVGVVVGRNPGRTFRDPVSVQVLDGLMQVLGDQGLGVLLLPTGPLVETAAMDVAVLLWDAVTDEPAITALRRRGTPVVVGEGPPLDGASLVAIEDRGGAAAAIRHLRRRGHTRIAEIALPLGVPAVGSPAPRSAGNAAGNAGAGPVVGPVVGSVVGPVVGSAGERSGPVTGARLAEARSTPAQNRLAGVRDVAQPVITWETPASLVEHGRDAAVEILGQWVPENERPTAIFAHSDLLAAGAVIAARELGLRVPEDVAIVGFDGIDLPWLSPDVLTSVHQPLHEKGAALGRAATGLLAGAGPTLVTLPVRLVEGTTT